MARPWGFSVLAKPLFGKLFDRQLFSKLGEIPVNSVGGGSPWPDDLTGNGYIGASFSGLEYAFIHDKPPSSLITYAKSNGVSLARVPVTQMKLQPTLGGALDQSEMDKVLAFGAALWAKGIAWYVDLHDYAHYDTEFDPPEGSPEGVYDHGGPGQGLAMGDPDYPISTFRTFFGLVAEQCVEAPGCVGIVVNNEPINMVSPNLIGDFNNFLDGQYWFQADTTVTRNAVVGPHGDMDGSIVHSTAAFGSFGWGNAGAVIESGDTHNYAIWARRHLGQAATFTAALGSDWNPTTLTDTWQLLGFVHTGTGAEDAIRWFIQEDNTSVEVAYAQLTEGSELVDQSTAPAMYVQLMQAAADELDEVVGETNPFALIVHNTDYSGMYSWLAHTFEVTRANGPIWYGVHDYPGDTSGDYTGDTWAALSVNLPVQATVRSNLIDYFEANNLLFIVDEINVPGNNANAADWNGALEDIIDQYQASPNCVGIVAWNVVTQQEGPAHDWFSLPDGANSVSMNPDDADQSKIETWRSKAKVGPFVPLEMEYRVAGNAEGYALGDSRTGQNIITTNFGNTGNGLNWIRQFTGQQLHLNVGNINGGSGETAATIRSSRFPTALASSAKVLVLLAGVNRGTSLSQDIADITAMCNDWVNSASDRIVWVFDELCPDATMAGAITAGFNVSGNMDRHVALRNAIRLLRDPANGIYVVPSWHVSTGGNDGTTPIAGFYKPTDGVHCTPLGSYLLGEMVTERPSLMASLPAYDPYSGATFSSDQTLNGGNFTGPGTIAAAGLALTGTGHTVGAVSDEDGDGNQWAKFNINGSADVQVNRSTGPLPAGVTPGVTKVRAILKYKVKVTNCRGFALDMIKQAGTGIGAAADGSNNGSASELGDLPLNDGYVYGTLMTGEITCPADATSLRWRFVMQAERIATVAQTMVGTVSLADGGIILT